jgi:hypothetical protein
LKDSGGELGSTLHFSSSIFEKQKLTTWWVFAFQNSEATGLKLSCPAGPVTIDL